MSSVYNVAYGPPTAKTEGSITVCGYVNPASPVDVLVRFAVGETVAEFDAARQQFEHAGDHTVTVHGFGRAAYSVVLGSGKTLVSTLVVLEGSTELLVTGTGPLSKAEALSRCGLPATWDHLTAGSASGMGPPPLPVMGPPEDPPPPA